MAFIFKTGSFGPVVFTLKLDDKKQEITSVEGINVGAKRLTVIVYEDDGTTVRWTYTWEPGVSLDYNIPTPLRPTYEFQMVEIHPGDWREVMVRPLWSAFYGE